MEKKGSRGRRRENSRKGEEVKRDGKEKEWRWK